MALYAQAGAEIFFAIATNGEVGGPHSPHENAAIRHEEAVRSVAAVGGELIWMGHQDEFLFDTRETRIRFIEAIRQARPDVMFVHSTSDYHPDHRIAGQIALDARIPAAVPLVAAALPACEKIPHVFVMDTLAGVSFEPEFFVDVSDVWSAKEDQLRTHASQVEWMRVCYGNDYVADARSHAELRGQAAGVAMAEAFRTIPTFPVTGGPEMLPGRWIRSPR